MPLPTDPSDLRKYIALIPKEELQAAIGDQIKAYRAHKDLGEKANNFYKRFFHDVQETIPRGGPGKNRSEHEYYSNWVQRFKKGNIDKDFAVAVLRWFIVHCKWPDFAEAIHRKLPLLGKQCSVEVDSNLNTKPVTAHTSGSPPTLHLGSVPRPVFGFIGRSAELDRIHAILAGNLTPAAITQEDSQVALAAVCGLPGVGKTSLAIAYSYRFIDHYNGVWWIKAETSDGILQGLTAIAKELHLTDDQDGNLKSTAAAALRGLAEANQNHLLIYDNVPQPKCIEQFLPLAGAKILITSRYPDWGDYGKEVPLDVLPLPEAVRYLKERAGRDDSLGAERLAVTLGRLPLALNHAAALCRQKPDISFSAYNAMAIKRMEALPDNSVYPHSVFATFSMAMELANERCPAAKALMDFIAHCAPESIPSALLAGAIADDAERDDAIWALSVNSLIQTDPPSDTLPGWSAHRLVQAVAKEKNKEPPAVTISLVGSQLNKIFPQDAYTSIEGWPLCEKLLPHAQVIFAFDAENKSSNSNFSALFDAVGLYLLSREMLEPASNFLHRALAIRRASPVPIPRDLSRTLSNIALYLHVNGELVEAMKYCVEAFSIREHSFGIEDGDTLISLNNLGYLNMDLERLKVAYKHFTQSLKYTRITYAVEPLEIATALDNLATCCEKMGRLDEARRHCEAGLALRTAEYERRKPECLADLICSFETLGTIALAEVRVEQSHERMEEAYGLFERVEEIAVELYGAKSMVVSPARMGMAEILVRKGELVRAEENFTGALAVTEATYGSYHDEMARCLEQYGCMLLSSGLHVGAEPIFRRAISIYEHNGGRKSANVRRSRKLLEKCKRRAEG